MSNIELSENIKHTNGTHANLTHAKEQLSEGTEIALKGVIEMLETAGYEVRKQSLEGRQAIEDYVKLNPLKSVGYSMLVGALTALLLKR